MCCPDCSWPCTSWQLTPAAPRCWASYHDVTHAGNDELGWLPASAAAAAPGCWLRGPRGREISASGAPHSHAEHHLPPSWFCVGSKSCLPSTILQVSAPICTQTLVPLRLCPSGSIPCVTGSARAATLSLCCLQSVAGLLNTQACASEGLQPWLAAAAGLRALRACAGELHAFEQLWAHLQLGQRLQALRLPGMLSHAGMYTVLPAVALDGSLPHYPSPAVPSVAGELMLDWMGQGTLLPPTKALAAGFCMPADQPYHFCRRADK